MIKLIGLDLDGTLLREDKSISNKSIEALRACEQNGIEYMVVTGRNYDLVAPIVDTYQLNCELLLNSGHQFTDFSGKTLEYISLDSDMTSDILNRLFENNFQISVHTTEGKFIFDEPNHYYERHIHLLRTIAHRNIESNPTNPLYNKEHFLNNTRVLPNPDEFMKLNIPVLKIDARHENAEITRNTLDYLATLTGIAVHSSFCAFVEITENKENKGTMLQRIAKRKGLEFDEIAVFGDGGNDMDMLSMFKNSYAMGNASDKVKAVANYIADTNENDGVAKEIFKIIANNQTL